MIKMLKDLGLIALILPLMACQSLPMNSPPNQQVVTNHLPVLTSGKPIIKTILPLDKNDPFKIDLKIVIEEDDLQVYETITNIDKSNAQHPIPTQHMPLMLYLNNPDGSHEKIENTIIVDTFGYGENEPILLDNVKNSLARSDSFSEFYDMPMGKHEYELWYYGKMKPSLDYDEKNIVKIRFIWDRTKVSKARNDFLKAIRSSRTA